SRIPPRSAHQRLQGSHRVQSGNLRARPRSVFRRILRRVSRARVHHRGPAVQREIAECERGEFMKRIVLSSCVLVLTLTSAGVAQQSPPKSDSSSAKPKKKLDADLSGFDVSDSKSDKKVATMLGGSRATAVPSATLLAPKRAKFYGASPLFSWTFAGHNEGYVLIITDEDEAQLEKRQTKDAHLLLDASKAKFQPGETYYWRIQVLPNTLASDPLEFVVVTAAEKSAIDKDVAAIPAGNSYDSALARARVFVDHRLWFDALGAYDDLITKNPNRAELYEDRATIYAQLPVTKPQAETDQAKAKSTK